MSKLSVASVRSNIRNLISHSTEHKRSFIETVEPQVCLKNYDPQRDKCFSGTLPMIRQISLVLRPGLSRAGKFPVLVSHEDFAAKIEDVKVTIRFHISPVCLAVAVGNVDMTEDEVIGNIMLAINYLVSLLKKGSLVIKGTMSPPRRLY
ncbi:ribosomal protein L1 [Periconia macrospinosa]|uniref:Ribosomal protein L1 n=1 Tax=Periconia macrospinosa TaxID=97972 RepID=A0A2V1DQ67_9PLEO|nr:ribosomal protein L1 [Periconia macrospinosa]